MRNRDLMIRKMEMIEGFIKTLRFCVDRNEPLEKYHDFLNRTEFTLEEVKSMIESEDISNSELNRIN